MVFPTGTDPAWIPEQRGPVPLTQQLRACRQQFLSLHKPSTTRKLRVNRAALLFGHLSVTTPSAAHGCHQPDHAHQLQKRIPDILVLFLQCTSFGSSLETTKKPLSSSGSDVLPGVQVPAHRGPPGQNMQPHLPRSNCSPKTTKALVLISLKAQYR